MRKITVYIPPVALQFVATLLLLSVVSVSSNELPPGEMAKQWWWLGRTGIVYAAVMSLSLLFCTRKINVPDYAHSVTWALILLGGMGGHYRFASNLWFGVF